MSEGRELYQPGVSPAANWEEIWLSTAAELVMASATRELGRAVWRTLRMELLRGLMLAFEKMNRHYRVYLQVLTGDSGREGGKGDELVLHFGDGTLSCRLWVLGDALNGNARGCLQATTTVSV